MAEDWLTRHLQVPDEEAALKIGMLTQGLGSFGSLLTNMDRERRGLQPGPSVAPINTQALMQFAALQRKRKEQEAAKTAIGGLTDVPESTRTLMGLFPEETIPAYIKGQMHESDPYRNTAGGLVDVRTKEIMAGTGPRIPPPRIDRIQVGNDIVSFSQDPVSGEPVILGQGPKWNPDVVHGRAGGSGGGGRAETPASGRGLAIIPDENSPSGFSYIDKPSAVGRSAPAPSSSFTAAREAAKTEAKDDKQAANISQLQSSLVDIRKTKAALQADPTLAGTLGWARRGAEWVTGNVAPGAPQPARDLKHSIESLRNQNIEAILRQPSSRVSDSDMKRAERIVGGTEKYDTPQDAVMAVHWLEQLVSGALDNIQNPQAAAAASKAQLEAPAPQPGAPAPPPNIVPLPQAPMKASTPMSLPKGVTMDEVEFTAKKHGMTNEQVIERLRAKQNAP